MQKQKPVVLVVDRESDAARKLVAFLRQNELEVRWSRDGESAFNVLDDGAVDCLVAEVKVQRIDGLALLQHARERNPEVCSVLVTEAASDQPAEKRA